MKKLSAKRLEILQYITDYTEQNGFPPSVREIGDAVGLRSPSTVHAHLKVLQEAGYLDKGEGKTRSISIKGSRQGFRSVPILGTVTAGVPILAQQEVEGYVQYDGSVSGELYALRVRGDSMIGAGILDGDIVIVRRQPDALAGDIVVALLDDEATVKRLSLRGKEVWLEPENPAYTPINGSDCSILGLVIALYRPRV